VERIQQAELLRFLKERVQPMEVSGFGTSFRAAVRLLDGVYLPCVLFAGRGRRIDLAVSRFKETSAQEDNYRRVVSSFVASHSSVAEWEIREVEPSPFAWPVALLEQIHGETVMGWTAFVVRMKDGSFFNYGTSFSFEFFDLPQGYAYEDISEIQSGVTFTQEGGAVPFRSSALKDLTVYRERPFFSCFLDGLI
jgi:hypothetical protein